MPDDRCEPTIVLGAGEDRQLAAVHPAPRTLPNTAGRGLRTELGKTLSDDRNGI